MVIPIFWLANLRYTTHYNYDGRAALFVSTINGYPTSPTWTAIGQHAYAEFGFSVTSGDVNGDGFRDLMIGSPGCIGCQTEGDVYLYLNNGSGSVHLAPDVTLRDYNNELFGYAITSGQDQDSDGYQDLLVGAPNATFQGLTGVGSVSLYRGTSSGVNPSSVWTRGPLAGVAEANEGFGTSVVMGDMNGDGFADVFVGAPNYNQSPNQPKGGRVYFYVTDSTPGGQHLPYYNVFVDGLCSNEYLGTSVGYGGPLVNNNINMIAGAPGAAAVTCPNVETWYWQP